MQLLLEHQQIVVRTVSFGFYWLHQWFPKFFWSRTICWSRTATSYQLVPGKLNLL